MNVAFDFHHIGLVIKANGYFYNQGSKVTKRKQTAVKMESFHQ